MYSLFDRMCEIYAKTDDSFKAGEFGRVDQWLSELDPTTLELDEVIAWACATYPAKDKLNQRRSFMERCPRAAIECFDGLWS